MDQKLLSFYGLENEHSNNNEPPFFSKSRQVARNKKLSFQKGQKEFSWQPLDGAYAGNWGH